MWVTLTGALQPVVHFRGVRIENAPWADSQPPVRRARVGDGGVLLAQRARGEAGDRAPDAARWRDRSRAPRRRPAQLAPEPARRSRAGPLQGARDPRRERDRALSCTSGSSSTSRRSAHRRRRIEAAGAAGGEALPTRLAIRGSWRSVPFAIDAATERGADLLRDRPHVSRARAGRLRAAPASTFDGQLGDIVRDPIVDARVALDGAVARALRAVARPPSPGGERDRRRRRAERRARALRAVDREGPPRRHRRRRRAELDARRGARPRPRQLDERVRRPGRPALRSPASDRRQAAERVAAGGARPRRALPRPSDAGADSRPLDAELSFAARRLHGEGMPWLQSGRVDAALADGRLDGVALRRRHRRTATPPARPRVDTHEQPLRGDAEVDVSAIRIESLLPPTGRQEPPERHAARPRRAEGERRFGRGAARERRRERSARSSAAERSRACSTPRWACRAAGSCAACSPGAEPIAIRCAAARARCRARHGDDPQPRRRQRANANARQRHDRPRHAKRSTSS